MQTTQIVIQHDHSYQHYYASRIENLESMAVRQNEAKSLQIMWKNDLECTGTTKLLFIRQSFVGNYVFCWILFCVWFTRTRVECRVPLLIYYVYAHYVSPFVPEHQTSAVVNGSVLIRNAREIHPLLIIRQGFSEWAGSVTGHRCKASSDGLYHRRFK